MRLCVRARVLALTKPAATQDWSGTHIGGFGAHECATRDMPVPFDPRDAPDADCFGWGARSIAPRHDRDRWAQLGPAFAASARHLGRVAGAGVEYSIAAAAYAAHGVAHTKLAQGIELHLIGAMGGRIYRWQNMSA